jgi:hypothetical protein
MRSTCAKSRIFSAALRPLVFSMRLIRMRSARSVIVCTLRAAAHMQAPMQGEQAPAARTQTVTDGAPHERVRVRRAAGAAVQRARLKASAAPLIRCGSGLVRRRRRDAWHQRTLLRRIRARRRSRDAWHQRALLRRTQRAVFQRDASSARRGSSGSGSGSRGSNASSGRRVRCARWLREQRAQLRELQLLRVAVLVRHLVVARLGIEPTDRSAVQALAEALAQRRAHKRCTNW